MRKQLNLSLFLARKVERVAIEKKLSFNDACIFLFSKVLAPRKNYTPNGASTSAKKPA